MGCLLKRCLREGGSVGEALGEGSGVGRRFAVGVSRSVRLILRLISAVLRAPGAVIYWTSRSTLAPNRSSY